MTVQAIVMMSGDGTRGDNTNSTVIVPSTGRVLVVSENTKSSSNISNIIPPRPSSSFYSDSSSSSSSSQFVMVNKDKKKCFSKIYDYNNCGYKLYENNIECFLEPIKKELIKRTYSRPNNIIIGNTTAHTSLTNGSTKVDLKNNNTKDDNNGEEEEREEEDLELLKDYLLDDFILNDIEFDLMHSIVREIENDELLNRSIWSPYSPSIDTNASACSESLLDDNNDEFILIGNNNKNIIKDENNIKSFPFTTTGRPSEQTGFKSKYTTFYRKQDIMEKEKSILNASSVSTSSTTFTPTSMEEELLGDNKFKYITNDSMMSQSTVDSNNIILSLKRNNDIFNSISNNYVLNNNERGNRSSFGVVDPKKRWRSELNQILLVHFDEHMLPLTYDYLTLNNNNNEMDINLLKRENTAIEIDRLRKKISIVTHKPIVFVYTYGFKSLNRAKQVLESRSCMYNISPFFKDINEFISFLNQMILF